MSLTIAIDARRIREFGVGSYIRNLVRALSEIEGDENRYLLLVASEEDRLKSLPENFDYVIESCPAYSLRELFALSWQLWRLDVDVFHATHYVLPAWVPAGTVMTVHDIVHLLYPSFLPNRLALAYAQRMIRRSLTRCDRLLCVSQNTKTDLLEYFEQPADKVEVVYNGVEERFRQRLSEEDLERALTTLELERPYLLFVGDPGKPHKNLDNLVKAYARAREQAFFDAPLVCVGAREGSDFKILQRARQLGIGDRVRLLGDVANEVLPALYQGASLFLYPTLYEGTGLPVVEAMASGVPVVTSSTSALREIAEGYAHMVSPLDVDEMAAAVAHCMRDAEHRAALAKLGTRRASDFRWERTAQRTLEVYRAAARERRGPREDGA